AAVRPWRRRPSPRCMPIRTRSGATSAGHGSPATASWASTAARAAPAGRSKAAKNASPSVLTTTPPAASMAPRSRASWRPTIAAQAAEPAARSERVEPSMSVNRKVTAGPVGSAIWWGHRSPRESRRAPVVPVPFPLLGSRVRSVVAAVAAVFAVATVAVVLAVAVITGSVMLAVAAVVVGVLVVARVVVLVGAFVLALVVLVGVVGLVLALGVLVLVVGRVLVAGLVAGPVARLVDLVALVLIGVIGLEERDLRAPVVGRPAEVPARVGNGRVRQRRPEGQGQQAAD